MIFKKEVLFPFAAALNVFSVVGLLIFAGLLGRGNLAADIAVMQGAILAIFHSLSANARNLILAGGVAQDEERNLFFFRLFLMVPAIIAVFLLVGSTTEVSVYLFAGLVTRKCSEWIAELHLANREVEADTGFAFWYVVSNGAALLLLVGALVVDDWNAYFDYLIIAWAVLPMLRSIPYARHFFASGVRDLRLAHLIPHMGSTTIIGFSTYVFRILIIMLAGKSLSGQMFSAYALGGILSSLYVQAVGPTLVHRGAKNELKYLLVVVTFCLLLGAMLALAGRHWEFFDYPALFVHAIGVSLVGGGIMILAQRQRLYILQTLKKDVFVPDALSNVLLIASVPFIFYIVGVESLAYLFLWSAILSLMFYVPLSMRFRSNDNAG